MKYIYIYTLFLMPFCHISCAQNQTNQPLDNFRKEHNGYSESELKEVAASRVPVSQVRNLKQDRNGNILIPASWGGVYQYDGKSFTNLTVSKIGVHRFWDVLEDRQGNLWFATLDSGVYCYNGKLIKHFTTSNGLASNMVMAIYEDKAGNIWFGASRYDGQTVRNFTTQDGLPDNGVKAIMEDKSGKLWFATEGGPCFYDARTDSTGGKIFTVLKNTDGNTFDNVWSVMQDKKGNIWFSANRGNSNGLWRYDGSNFIKISQNAAYAIIQDKKGNIWTTGGVTANTWALSRYDAKSLYDKNPTVTEIKTGGFMDFLALLEANDGSIWFGSAGGVHRYDGNAVTDFNHADERKKAF